jgi:hypothetical protein
MQSAKRATGKVVEVSVSAEQVLDGDAQPCGCGGSHDRRGQLSQTGRRHLQNGGFAPMHEEPAARSEPVELADEVDAVEPLLDVRHG